MPANRTAGVPPARAILAPTAFALPEDGCRLTIVAALPLVPVREMVADALRSADPDSVAWVDLGSDEDGFWTELGTALGDHRLTSARAVHQHLAGLRRALHLVVVVPSSASSSVDADLLSLLDTTAHLRLTVIAGGRRPIETAALTRPDSTVVSSSALVVDAAGIASYATSRGLDLTDDEAAALARTAATLPDVLPAVVSSALSGMFDQPGSRLTSLEGEAAFALSSRLAAVDDEQLHDLLAFAVPFLLTPSAVTAADIHGRAGLNLPAIAAAGLIDRDEEARGYRLRLALRSSVLPELERRFPTN